MGTECNVPRKIIREIEVSIYEFLWNGRAHKVKCKVLIQNYGNGEYKMTDLDEMIKAQKIKFIKR